jgi:16S rRNA (cytosine967-C5)-methyltransferase
VSRYYSYLNSAADILQQYNGHEPFAAFLKSFFSTRQKYGSTDRKQIAHLCYCYFRLGKALPDMPVEERILTGLFLCSQAPNKILEAVKPEWNEKTVLSIEEKCSMLNVQYSTFNVFPWINELSKGIVEEEFTKSFFVQPDLFLRLRPGKEKIVKEKLAKAGVDFTILNDNCIALPNSSKIEESTRLNEEVVIQDYSSQQTGVLLAGLQPGRLWDCCAASGGKSIMAWDMLPGIDLIVSDKRESIIANLKKRFREAGIQKYQSFVADLSTGQTPSSLVKTPPSIIIADVPCTGSGTWSRTPEQLFYFEEQRISEYAALQKKIMQQVVPHLEAGGHLLYITCSVFKKENEEMLDFLQEKFSMQVLQKKVLTGYEMKADTMFAALLRKS